MSLQYITEIVLWGTTIQLPFAANTLTVSLKIYVQRQTIWSKVLLYYSYIWAGGNDFNKSNLLKIC